MTKNQAPDHKAQSDKFILKISIFFVRISGAGPGEVPLVDAGEQHGDQGGGVPQEGGRQPLQEGHTGRGQLAEQAGHLEGGQPP